MIGLYGSSTTSSVSYLGVAKFNTKCDPYAVLPADNDVINGNGTGTGIDTDKNSTGTGTSTDKETGTGTGIGGEM